MPKTYAAQTVSAPTPAAPKPQKKATVKAPAPKQVKKKTSTPAKKIEKKKIKPPLPAILSASTLTVPKLNKQIEVENSPAKETEYELIDELLQLMRTKLTLPEKGKVKIELDLDVNGHIIDVQLLESRSKRNAKYLLEQLPTLTLVSTRKSTEKKPLRLTLVFVDE